MRISDWSSDVCSSDLRQAKPLGNSEVTLAEIQPGNFFIVGGQLAYVAASTDAFTTQYERADRRVRVIYDNATEATVLSRSFQKSLSRDETARRVREQSRSDERRVGKECGRTFRSWGARDHYKKKKKEKT